MDLFTLTQDQIQSLRELSEAAAPGEWFAVQRMGGAGVIETSTGAVIRIEPRSLRAGDDRHMPDVRFATAAVNLLRQALALQLGFSPVHNPPRS